MRRAAMARKVAFSLLLAASVVARSAAAADEQLAEQIEQYSRVLSSLESEDAARRVSTELSALRNRLLEGRMLLREEKTSDLERLLKVVKTEVQMIKALVALGAAEQRAMEQRSQADEVEDKLGKLQRQKEMLEQRLTQLEEQARGRGQGTHRAAPAASDDATGKPNPAPESPKE